MKKLIWGILPLLLTAFFMTACKQVTINEIEYIPAQIDAAISGSIEIDGQSFLLDNENRNYKFENKNAKVKANISFVKINQNMGNDRPVKLTLELTSSNTKRRTKVKQKSLKSGKVKLPGLDCSNTVKTSLEGKKLIIDMSSFKSFKNCKGFLSDHYNTETIGQRELNRTTRQSDSLLASIGEFFVGGNLFSIDDDYRLGREFSEAFVKENKDSILAETHPMSQYVQNVMEKIARVSDMSDLRPTTYVINADIMNAFALPGGFVFVFRGLIEKVQNESELVAVLGHEWAHVTARHGTENVTRSIKITLDALAAAALAQGVAKLTKKKGLEVLASVLSLAFKAGGSLFILNKGRKAELEADKLGAQYAYELDYEPYGIAKMFTIFKEESGKDNITTFEKLMSSHPDHDTRIQTNLMYSSFFFPERDNYVANTSEFEDAKIALADIPVNADYGKSKEIGTAFINDLQSIIDTEIQNHLDEYIDFQDLSDMDEPSEEEELD